MNTSTTLRLAVLSVVVALAATAADQGYSRFARQKELARQAESAERLGKYAAAARAYRKSALQASDNRTRAALLLRQAECHQQARDPHEAYAAYKKLLEAYPLYVPYDRVLPRLRQLAGDFERGVGSWFGIGNRTQAIAVYETILQETPVGSGAMRDSLQLGALLQATGRSAEAVPVYREALRRFPGDPLAGSLRLELGRLLAEDSRSGDGDGRLARQAVRELDGFMQAHPDDPRRRDAQALIDLMGERRAEGLYQLGQFYLRPAHRREPAARRYLADASRVYPGTVAAAQAEALLASLGPAPVSPEEPPAAVAEAPAAAVEAVAVPAAVEAAAPAEATRAPRRLLQGLLPRRGDSDGKPRTFRSLKEREDVNKWLLPLGDVNDLEPAGGAQ